MGLGVSMVFNTEKNLQIIREKAKKDYQLTKMQVNYLSRFTWIGHQKGKKYPECQCLRCLGINLLEGMR